MPILEPHPLPLPHRYRFATEHNEDSDDEAEYYDRKEKEIFNKIHFTKIVQDEEDSTTVISGEIIT